MGTDNLPQTVTDGPHRESPVHSQRSSCSLDKEAGMATCRVCQCAESDKRGDVALDFLGISAPFPEPDQNGESLKPETTKASTDDASRDSGMVEFISPRGEVFICSMDLEMGQFPQQHSLLELGCSCKSDLALVHYACALKWFVSHGSTVCEICGQCATNIRTADVKKVVLALKDYETLRERTVIGHLNPSQVTTDSSVDPDAIAAIRRQRLSEISLWFSTHRHSVYNNNSAAVSQIGSEQPLSTVTEDSLPSEHPATKWAVEGTGILLATGLLTVTLAWLIAPRVGKKTAKNGLHILLGGVCALAVVVFFRFFVLTRIRYGPSRYWAILFVFWFLVFGIWASRTHGAHTTT